MTKEEAYSLTYGSKIWNVVKYFDPKRGSFSVTIEVGAVKEVDARNKLSITYPKEAHRTDWRWVNRDIFHLEKGWFTSEQKAMEYKEKLLSEIFDWKTLTDGYTLFAGEYHADTYRNFKGEWNWYAFKGNEMIGSGKGLKDSSVSRAAAEKAIRAHQWGMSIEHKPYFDRLRNMFKDNEHQEDGILVATAKRNDLGEPVVEVVETTTKWLERDPICPSCGESVNLHYNDQYANGERWHCNVCKHEFMHQKSASGGK